MNQSRISYNINGQATPVLETLEKHLAVLQPRWVLIMDNPTMGKDLAGKLPHTNVILRNWQLTGGDENVYSKLTPEQWLDARLPEAGDRIYLSTANEAGINAKWDIDLMNLIVSKNLKHVKLVLGNPSVGTPSIGDWTNEDKREWFKLLDSHRDQFVLGCHEYFCGIAPSGFVGGYPDGSWMDGRTNLHLNYEDKRNWPKDASIIGQLWHCGRIMSVNAAARQFGVMPPRIVISEHGADDLADMHGWLAKFLPSGGRPNIRAWKTLTNLWAKILPGLSSEQSYFDNISYLDEAVYSHFPNVEGQLLYTWSSSTDWKDFDLSEAGQFQTLLETYATALPTPAPIPVPEPPKPPAPPVEKMITLPASIINKLRIDTQACVDVTDRMGQMGKQTGEQMVLLGQRAIAASRDLSDDLSVLNSFIRDSMST